MRLSLILLDAIDAKDVLDLKKTENKVATWPNNNKKNNIQLFHGCLWNCQNCLSRYLEWHFELLPEAEGQGNSSKCYPWYRGTTVNCSPNTHEITVIPHLILCIQITIYCNKILITFLQLFWITTVRWTERRAITN
jgi:hypothetical protein